MVDAEGEARAAQDEPQAEGGKAALGRRALRSATRETLLFSGPSLWKPLVRRNGIFLSGF